MNSGLNRNQFYLLYLLASLAVILPIVGYRVVLNMKAAPLTASITPPLTPPNNDEPPVKLPPSMPDLAIIGQISVSPDPVTVGKKVLVTYKLTNKGSVLAKRVQYAYVNQAGGASQVGLSNTCVYNGLLKPRESCTVSNYFTFTTVGDRTLTIKLDPNNLIREWNEMNNLYIVSLEVSSPGPTPTSIRKIKILPTKNPTSSPPF